MHFSNGCLLALLAAAAMATPLPLRYQDTASPYPRVDSRLPRAVGANTRSSLASSNNRIPFRLGVNAGRSTTRRIAQASPAPAAAAPNPPETYTEIPPHNQPGVYSAKCIANCGSKIWPADQKKKYEGPFYAGRMIDGKLYYQFALQCWNLECKMPDTYSGPDSMDFRGLGQ